MRHPIPILKTMLVILILVLAACSPSQDGEPAETGATDTVPGTTPTPAPTLATPSPSPATTDDLGDDSMDGAFINELRLNVLESFPVQVRATVTGNLSDACTSITSTSVQQMGNRFQIKIETTRDPELICAQVLAPFEETIELDVRGLPAGTYTVTAGDQSESFTLTVDNELPQPTPDLSGADATTPTVEEGVNETVNGQFTRTHMFLIALEDNGQSGQLIGCGDSVVPIVIEIEPTITPMTAALSRLLSLEDEFYGQSGLYNVFYQSELMVDAIDIEDGIANVHLSGALVLGGVCDNPRVMAQLEQTILQYSNVNSAIVLLNGEPLETILSGQ